MGVVGKEMAPDDEVLTAPASSAEEEKPERENRRLCSTTPAYLVCWNNIFRKFALEIDEETLNRLKTYVFVAANRLFVFFW